MALFSFEVRVSANLTIEIACEDAFNSSGSSYLIGSYNGQFFPVSVQQVSGYPIGHFVDSCPLGLYFWGQFAFLCSFGCCLDDIVIFLFAQNGAPKFDFLDLFGNAELFHCFKDDVGSFLSKADSGFVQHLRFFH